MSNLQKNVRRRRIELLSRGRHDAQRGLIDRTADGSHGAAATDGPTASGTDAKRRNLAAAVFDEAKKIVEGLALGSRRSRRDHIDLRGRNGSDDRILLYTSRTC